MIVLATSSYSANASRTDSAMDWLNFLGITDCWLRCIARALTSSDFFSSLKPLSSWSFDVRKSGLNFYGVPLLGGSSTSILS